MTTENETMPDEIFLCSLGITHSGHPNAIEYIRKDKAIPPGYALVPIEPTHEMAKEGACFVRGPERVNDDYYAAKDIYKAMIAAGMKG